MRVSDFVWELIDNGLYVAHLVLIMGVATTAIACTMLLYQIRTELAVIRECVATAEPHCRHCDPDAPVPVLPRVLPRLRRIGEEPE